MSIKKVVEFVEMLPYSLKEQVLGYARSVKDAMPDIFEKAGVKYTETISDKVIYIAGLKKLYSICNSSFWAIENTNYLLRESQVNNVKVGGTDMSKGSDFYIRLSDLLNDIDKILDDNGIRDEVTSISYSDLVRKFHNG